VTAKGANPSDRTASSPEGPEATGQPFGAAPSALGAQPVADDLADLPFDQYTRHRIVQRVADAVRADLQKASLEILDVGGYPCLTPHFVPTDRVRVVDVVPPTQGADHAAAATEPPYICADGAALPFVDGAFDLVVSLDSLEHVLAERRDAYVSELLRVSRGYVLLVAPFAQDETVLAEQLVAEFVRVVNQEEQPQLREHREYGLPRLQDWVDFVGRRGLAHVAFSSGYVYNWLPMMLLKHYVSSLPNSDMLHRAIDHFYNVTLQASDARTPGYRQGMLISTLGPSTMLDEMARVLAPSGAADRLEVVERMEQIGLLLKLADLHVASRRDDRLRDDLLAKERHIQNLETERVANDQRRVALDEEVATLRARIGELEAHLDAVRNGRVMRSLDAISQLRAALGGGRRG
jgi:hypothetical protein